MIEIRGYHITYDEKCHTYHVQEDKSSTHKEFKTIYEVICFITNDLDLLRIIRNEKKEL